MFDEDGNEFDMPSKEELEDLKSKNGKVEEYEGLVKNVREALEISEDDDLIESIKLAKEASNPNWKSTREKIAKLQTFIKANIKDASLDEEGNVTMEEKIDPKAIEESARKAAREEIFGQEINKHLEKYPADSREAVKKYFEKLSAGEELNSETIAKTMDEAGSIVVPKPASNPGTNLSGGEPRIKIEDGQDFSETEQGKEIAKEVFGDEAFSAEKKGDE